MIDRWHIPLASRVWRNVRIVVGIAALITLGVAALFASAGFFAADPVHLLPPVGRRNPIGVVYFTGDMGLRFGMSAVMSQALAAHGFAVYALNSPTVFATRRTRGEVDRIVADTVRQGLARTRSDRVVLVGQSYGSDILQTGLAALPAGLRGKVAGVVLVVPGDTVYFRADPSTLAYRGTPDSIGAATAGTLGWTPLTCIYGQEEGDSLCPLLHLPRLHAIAMPGGHFLDHDSAGLIAHVLAAMPEDKR